MVEVNVSQIATDLVGRGVNALTAIVAVFFFLAVGYIIAWALGEVIKAVLKKLKLEEFIKKHELDNALMGLSITQMVTVVVKVYIIFLFLGMAADAINMEFLAKVAGSALEYIPSLVQGLIIITAVLFVGAYISNTIKREKKIGLANQLAIGVQLFIAYIGLLLSMPLLLPGIGDRILVLERILELFITAIVIAIGLGAGLALGLGLKDSVARAASKNEEMMEFVIGKHEKKGL